jgi:hypothetical protein
LRLSPNLTGLVYVATYQQCGSRHTASFFAGRVAVGEL